MKKLLYGLFIVFLSFCVVTGWFVFDKLNKLTEKPDQIDGEIIEEDLGLNSEGLSEQEMILSQSEIFKDSDVFNILLLRTDERTKEFNTNARADSIMLLSINKKTNELHLIIIERGMGVPILDGAYKGQVDWITHCFRYGGAELMLKEVSKCFKVDVSHYARVSFHAFEQLIDSVGGVDIELTQSEVID